MYSWAESAPYATPFVGKPDESLEDRRARLAAEMAALDESGTTPDAG